MTGWVEPLVVMIERAERDGRGLATLFAEVRFVTAQGETIIVPVGFETDFCSIPRLLMWLLPILGKASRAAVIHDYLLKMGIKPRAECDAIFLEVMTEDRVGLLRRYAMWAGVRIYGILKA